MDESDRLRREVERRGGSAAERAIVEEIAARMAAPEPDPAAVPVDPDAGRPADRQARLAARRRMMAVVATVTGLLVATGIVVLIGGRSWTPTPSVRVIGLVLLLAGAGVVGVMAARMRRSR